MPTLNWIGKEAVVKHHKDVPFRLLEPVADLSCGSTDSGNLIVQGDNLHALEALLPRYAGRVKCIYIDPCAGASANDSLAIVGRVAAREIRGELSWIESNRAWLHQEWRRLNP